MTWYVGVPPEGKSLYLCGVVYEYPELPADHPDKQYIGEEYDIIAVNAGSARYVAHLRAVVELDPGWVRIDVLRQF